MARNRATEVPTVLDSVSLTSPLGDPGLWPQSLRSVVGLLLGSKFPMFVAWGPELGRLYNDAYSAILGDKHPAALGGRFAYAWADAWADLKPLMDAAPILGRKCPGSFRR